MALAAFAISCGPTPEAETVAPAQAACQILPAPRTQPETLAIALPDAIDPVRAPHPSNDAERVVFSHLYETLIGLDCQGDVKPGLAQSWSSNEGGRRWTFTLRPGAEFWDGTPVTAERVAAGWRDLASAARAAGVLRADAQGDFELALSLDQPRLDVPRFLADPAFAVALHTSPARWPLGSGAYRPYGDGLTAASAASGGVTVLPVEGRDRPVIQFRSTTGTTGDARDILEDEVDALITSDPDVLDYAAAHSRFDDKALPWNRSYLLFSTTRARELRRGRPVAALSNRVTDQLARDAVRGDARGYRPSAWWDDLSACVDPYRLLAGLPPIATGADNEDLRRILYDQGDPTARDLAERIAALAATDPHDSPEAASLAAAVPGVGTGASPPRAFGLGAERFFGSLREGSDFAYVIPVQAHVADPCLEITRLVEAVEWSAQVGTSLSSLPLPLVSTRAHVLYRSGRVGLTVDWSGTPRVTTARAR